MQRFSSDRREFIKRAGVAVGGLAALGGAGAGALAWRRNTDAEDAQPQILPSSASNIYTDVALNLTMAAGTANILAGTPTNVWKYTAVQTQGRTWQVQAIPNSFLGPIIKVARGNRLRVRMQNNLPEATITHWHGLDIPEDQDGHPRFAVPPGGHYDYDFIVNDRAGLYWFHPHPDMRTGAQVMNGLAGLLMVTDKYEEALNLPRGEYELPLVIQDRTFDGNNQFDYTFGPLPGFMGNTILINGQPNYVKSCRTRIYRLRVLNGSNGRTYKLAWSDGSPVVVIGSEGGFLPAPVSMPYVMLSPGERLDIWADFSGKALGSDVVLKSLAWTPGGFGGGGNPPNGTPFDLATFHMNSASTETLTLPASFPDFETLTLAQAVNAASPRTFPITYIVQGGQPKWLFNGAVYDINTTLPNEEVPRNTVELWQVTNTSSTVMPHPIHFHGKHFQVLQRIGPASGSLLTNYNGVKDGFLGTAWKDTFLIMPGETVKLLVRTSNFPGLYVMHCHVLEHEDMGMMRNLRVMP